MTDEPNRSADGPFKPQTDGEDRVRMVARQLMEPRTANWIATEADWSHGPTTRVLERLVDEGLLRYDDSGRHTTYVPEYRYQLIQEAIRLRDTNHTVEELTDRLGEMRAQIQDWKTEFEVESSNQLRATIAERELGRDEEERRREIAREWDHLQRRIRIVGFTIREWDFLAPKTDRAMANN